MNPRAQVLLLAVLVGTLVVPSARAQDDEVWAGPVADPTQADLRRARGAYVEGTERASEGRWADALDSFARAYAWSGVPAALFNVATTLRSLGRYRAARDAFEQLLADHTDADPEMITDATRFRNEVAERVARVLVRGVPPVPGVDLWLDGHRRALDDTRPIIADLDPGRRTLRLELDQHEPWTWEGVLADGESLSLDAVLTPLPEPPRRRPALWTTIAVVVAAGLAVGAYFAFFHDRNLVSESPFTIRL